MLTAVGIQGRPSKAAARGSVEVGRAGTSMSTEQ
jgi:hypothetical protein